MGWNSLAITHDFMARQVALGAFCIDATAGKGRDAVLLARLCGPTGRVVALDIQPQAVEATRRLAEDAGVSGWLEARQMDHRELSALAPPGTVDFVAFNLGWLPGGDHRLHTRWESTLPALNASLELLRPGGALSLCIYYGRENGYGERDRVLEWLAGLDDRQYNVLVLGFPNRRNDPPIPVLILKEG